MPYTIDGLEYEAEVKVIHAGPYDTVYVTLLPVDRPREYGESYALWLTVKGWEYVGATKMRVTGKEAHGWILDARNQESIDLLVKIAEEKQGGTMTRLKMPAQQPSKPRGVVE